jgi:ATP-dependent DNA ligase
MGTRAKPARPVAVPLPASLAPALATLVASAPATPSDWVFEVKFDSYRMLARVDVVRLHSSMKRTTSGSARCSSILVRSFTHPAA